MLLDPSPKPLTRIIALGDEGLLLEALGGVQNYAATLGLAVPINTEDMIDSEWSLWWFIFAGESQRFYCAAPRGSVALERTLFYQSFSILVWIIDRPAEINPEEKGLLQAIAFSGTQQAIIVFTQPATDKEALAVREHLQEAGIDGNNAIVIDGGSDLKSTHEAMLQALEALQITKSAPSPSGFYMPIDRVIEGATSSALFGQIASGQIAPGNSLEISGGKQLMRSSIRSITLLDAPLSAGQRAIAGYPACIILEHPKRSPFERWEAASAPGLLFPTAHFDTETRCYTVNQGGLRRSWGRGDKLSLSFHFQERAATIEGGLLRPGESSAASFKLQNKLPLKIGVRFFMRVNENMIGVGIIKKIK